MRSNSLHIDAIGKLTKNKKNHIAEVDQVKTGDILNRFPALRTEAALIICGKNSFKNSKPLTLGKSKSLPLTVGKI